MTILSRFKTLFLYTNRYFNVQTLCIFTEMLIFSFNPIRFHAPDNITWERNNNRNLHYKSFFCHV